MDVLIVRPFPLLQLVAQVGTFVNATLGTRSVMVPHAMHAYMEHIKTHLVLQRASHVPRGRTRKVKAKQPRPAPHALTSPMLFLVQRHVTLVTWGEIFLDFPKLPVLDSSH